MEDFEKAGGSLPVTVKGKSQKTILLNNSKASVLSVLFNVSGTYDLRRASSVENFKSGHKYFIQTDRLLQIVMAVQFSVWFVFHGGLTPQPYHRCTGRKKLDTQPVSVRGDSVAII